MKTNQGCAANGSGPNRWRGAVVLLLGAAAFALTSCAAYYGPPYAGGYYSAGYGSPYGYGYGSPYYGSPYYSPYGYGGASIVISGARYHGYRSPYYRNGYYPRARVQSGTYSTRSGAGTPPARVRGSTTRTANPRTQATVPQ